MWFDVPVCHVICNIQYPGNGRIDGTMNDGSWLVERGWVDACIWLGGVWMDGWMARWVDGCTDGMNGMDSSGLRWMDGWIVCLWSDGLEGCTVGWLRTCRINAQRQQV